MQTSLWHTTHVSLLQEPLHLCDPDTYLQPKYMVWPVWETDQHHPAHEAQYILDSGPYGDGQSHPLWTHQETLSWWWYKGLRSMWCIDNGARILKGGLLFHLGSFWI